MRLLLKFQDPQSFNTAGEVREYFHTPINQPSHLYCPTTTVPLILDKGQLYLQILPDDTSHTDLIQVNTDIFNQKIADNKLHFVLDQNNILLTLARSIVAGIMSQTHTYHFSEDLIAQDPDAHLFNHLQENLQAGTISILPIAIMIYFILQYGNYYYKTGQWLSVDDPKFRQILRNSGVLGIQTLCICISIACARAIIPLVLKTLTLLPAGIVTHLLTASIFGLLFASSLLIYDLAALATGYGQMTGSPGTRFLKNLAIGFGLYLVQLIPGLGSLHELERVARATLAFLVPSVVNYSAHYLPTWKNQLSTKALAPGLGDLHDKKISLVVH